MRGWKTWTGALIVAASAILQYFGMQAEAAALLKIGAAMSTVGIGHKIEKAAAAQGLFV